MADSTVLEVPARAFRWLGDRARAAARGDAVPVTLMVGRDSIRATVRKATGGATAVFTLVELRPFTPIAEDVEVTITAGNLQRAGRAPGKHREALVRIDRGAVLVVQSGQARVRLEVTPGHPERSHLGTGGGASVRVPARRLGQVLRLTGEYMGDPLHDHTGHALVRIDDKLLTSSATDGSRLARISLPVMVADEQPDRCLLGAFRDPADLKLAAKACLAAPETSYAQVTVTTDDQEHNGAGGNLTAGGQDFARQGGDAFSQIGRIVVVGGGVGGGHGSGSLGHKADNPPSWCAPVSPGAGRPALAW